MIGLADGKEEGNTAGIMKAQCQSWLLVGLTRVFSDLYYASPTVRRGASN
jgi:hypothetical protein